MVSVSPITLAVIHIENYDAKTEKGDGESNDRVDVVLQ
jgi:hypothetical protein